MDMQSMKPPVLTGSYKIGVTGFHVVDIQTGEEPDISEIALNEDWAKGLIYCDMEGFFIDENARLILADECGNYCFVPSDRYKVVWHVVTQPVPMPIE